MKPFSNLRRPLVASGCFMLMVVNVACDCDKVPSMDNSDAGLKSSYDAGYELGMKLAQLKQLQPDAKLNNALTGLCDALSKTGNQIDKPGVCESAPVAASIAENPENQVLSSPPKQPVNKGSSYSPDDFAALNARRNGVVVLPSTVQYEVLREGSGRKPDENDTVVVNYRATLEDGKVIDSTYGELEPARMDLSDIAIPGLKEALLLMKEGDQWRVVIPPKMGFGRSGNNRLRRRVLIYEIELVSIEKPKAVSMTP